MKILFLDIETTPHKAYVWKVFDEFVSREGLEEPTKVLCWAAKWHGSDEMLFSASWRGHKTMLRAVHKLLSEADVVVHYNGTKFDIPHLNREFLEHGMAPPSPFKSVDLYQVIRRQFRFPFNKLNDVARRLHIGEKIIHEGIGLWIRAMERDPEALVKMENYNKQDVVLLEELYNQLRPWIEKHPNHGAFSDIQCCPKCGSVKFQKRGYAVTTIARYIRYQCSGCGGWFRGSTNLRTSGDKTRNVTP